MSNEATGSVRVRHPLSWAAILPFVPSWPSIVAIFAFGFASFSGAHLLGDPDTFLHITAGNWTFAHGALPTSDPFSHSMPGAHWIVHEWLAELVIAATYDAFRWHGLVLLTAGCFGITVAIVTHYLLKRGEALTSLLIVVGALLLLLPHLLPRPHVLAWPVMALWCVGVITARDDRRSPSFALLPLMTLWANLHGSFMVGLGLVVFLSVEAAVDRGPNWRSELRDWTLFTVLACAAGLLNPNGLQIFLLPIRFMGMAILHNTFLEWLSPNFHNPQPLELWLLMLIFGGYGCGLKLPPLRLLFMLGLVHLALQAGRHGDLLAILGPIITCAALGPQLKARIEAGGTTWIASGFAALTRTPSWQGLGTSVIAIIAIGGGSLFKPAEIVNATPSPVLAVGAAQRLGLSGPVLNDEGFGGYLIFNGIPTFIDGRVEMYGPDFLGRFVKAELGDEATLTALLNEYHIQWTLFAAPSGAALVLKRLPGWERVYTDKFAIIDRRVSSSNN